MHQAHHWRAHQVHQAHHWRAHQVHQAHHWRAHQVHQAHHWRAHQVHQAHHWRAHQVHQVRPGFDGTCQTSIRILARHLNDNRGPRHIPQRTTLMRRALDLPAGIRHGRVEQPLANVMLYAVLTDILPAPLVGSLRGGLNCYPSSAGAQTQLSVSRASHSPQSSRGARFQSSARAHQLPGRQVNGCPTNASSTHMARHQYAWRRLPEAYGGAYHRQPTQSTSVSGIPAVCPRLCPKPSTCPFHRLSRLRRLRGGGGALGTGSVDSVDSGGGGL